MSVLKGEGKYPILFGTTSIAAGTRIHRGYLARPDLAGEWPTMVVVADVFGVSSAIKDLCRRLARHGFAALAPDLYRGAMPSRGEAYAAALARALAVPEARALGDMRDIAGFITNPAGHWSNAEEGFGVLGIGAGGRLAALASRDLDAAALAVCYPLLGGPDAPDSADPGEADETVETPEPMPGAAEPLSQVTQPLLGLFARDDDQVPVERVHQLRALVPHAEFVLYDNTGHGFLDDNDDAFDESAFNDALNRLIDFFDKRLSRPD